MRLTFGQRSFLLTGDMERPMEQRALANGLPLAADVLKVGHHGSNTSTTGAFLDAVSPTFAVISDGFQNSFHHPHPQVPGTARRASRCRIADGFPGTDYHSDRWTSNVGRNLSPTSTSLNLRPCLPKITRAGITECLRSRLGKRCYGTATVRDSALIMPLAVLSGNELQ